METRKIIIDTDPGIDDAAAISVMLSEPSLDVKLIASVSGNVGIEHTTNNALKLLTFLKNLDSRKYLVIRCEYYNRRKDPPMPVLIVKIHVG